MLTVAEQEDLRVHLAVFMAGTIMLQLLGCTIFCIRVNIIIIYR
jgi:hypothetical protein